MILSQKHETARTEAARLPALQATFALLAHATGLASIGLYKTATPDDQLIVSIPLGSPVGIVDEELIRVDINTPIEGQVTLAGTNIPDYAVLYDGEGDAVGTLTVSDTNGEGEIKLETLDLVEGAFARIKEAYLQG